VEASRSLFSDGIQFKDIMLCLLATLFSLLRKKCLETADRKDVAKANLHTTAYKEALSLFSLLYIIYLFSLVFSFKVSLSLWKLLSARNVIASITLQRSASFVQHSTQRTYAS